MAHAMTCGHGSLCRIMFMSFSKSMTCRWRRSSRVGRSILRTKQTGCFEGGVHFGRDYFDTFMRDSEHEEKTVRYIERNPAKAELVLDPRDWLWSSRRLRDAHGRLCL